MKIKLPEEMKGVIFPHISIIEMNDFDIDIFLPALFFTILAEGKGKAKQTNNPQDIDRYLGMLAEHADLQGFQSAEGRKLLERLVRTALIITGKIGEGGKKGEQIISLVPYTILTHKTGLPATRRQRRVDVFLYLALRDRLQGDDKLKKFVKEVFGRGVEIGPGLDLGGKYDGKTPLDILTRLSIAFIDGFAPTRPRIDRARKAASAFPALVDELAKDIEFYLRGFSSLMPDQAFTYNLLALINFELFIYTLRMVHATNALVSDPKNLPAAMQDTLQPSTPQMYLDFTDGATTRSVEMSRICVRRDIEAYQQFLWSNLLLRQLDIYAKKQRNNPRKKAEMEKILPHDVVGAHYVQNLLLLQDDSRINAYLDITAQMDEDLIKAANTEGDEGEDAETHRWLESIASTGTSNIERVVNLLAEAQRDANQHSVQWFYGVGGLKKPHGILRGTLQQRQAWRYAPENDLLAALVQVVTARLSPPGKLRSIKLQEFLEFLEYHYGILIDRPPEPFMGAEYAAAASDNLRAMLRRLRQMGIFRDLSDDFTVQRLHAPYAGTQHRKVEVQLL